VESIQPELPGVNLIAFTDLGVLMDEVFRVGREHQVTPEQAGGHAGEHETSLILAVRPDLVQMAQARPGYVGDQMTIAPVVFKHGFRHVTENGVLGDPRGASAANGTAYLDALTDLMVRFIDERRTRRNR
jgi:creatinine amidohydrolase